MKAASLSRAPHTESACSSSSVDAVSHGLVVAIPAWMSQTPGDKGQG